MVLPRSLCSRIITLWTCKQAHLRQPHRPVQTTTSTTPVTAAQRTEHTTQVRRRHSRTQINFDTIGSWNNRLDLPLNLEYSIKSGTVIPENSLDNVGSASLLGRRKENEDRYHLQELTGDTLMVSIFDGHGGSMAANFTWQHMAEHIVYWLDSGVTDLQLVLKKAFSDLNEAFTRFATQNYKGSEHALVSGTTATICLLRQNHELVIGHVGDSVAILCRDGKAIRLTKDHHLENMEEEERVKSMGGTITSNGQGKPRVNGRLDMTRSIGDLDLKPYGVIAEPSTMFIKIKHSRDAFLVLTTDGVNVSLTDQEIVDIINGRTDPEEAAKQVTDQSLQFGSEDNATAVVMPFGAWGKYSRSVSTIQYDFGRNIIGPRYS